MTCQEPRAGGHTGVLGYAQPARQILPLGFLSGVFDFRKHMDFGDRMCPHFPSNLPQSELPISGLNALQQLRCEGGQYMVLVFHGVSSLDAAVSDL